MQIINTIFLKIVEQSFIAGIVILIVIVVRALLKRFPKNLAYFLWIAVAFRLIIPVSIDSEISVYNLFHSEKMGLKNINSEEFSNIKDTVAADKITVENPQKITGETIINNTENIVYPKYQVDKNSSIAEISHTEKTITNFKRDDWISILTYFWLSGILVLMCYTIAVHRKIKRKIQFGIWKYGRVYECDKIRSRLYLE